MLFFAFAFDYYAAAFDAIALATYCCLIRWFSFDTPRYAITSLFHAFSPDATILSPRRRLCRRF